ncbi:uncharacterized protein LOC143184931 isoform X2 [Calliopsis andreniformis]|uniref:uncharacterized protein LOC143184931 isoform X2 n=1 Tax=Calliopsis andreniformis TaxID=337506 RepID=UPI003FCE8C93
MNRSSRMNVTNDTSVCDIDRRYPRRFYLLRPRAVTSIGQRNRSSRWGYGDHEDTGLVAGFYVIAKETARPNARTLLNNKSLFFCDVMLAVCEEREKRTGWYELCDAKIDFMGE